ncbi:MAG: hypothetical protein HYZ69_00775 [Candidatus Colwellbacteria bacterium]|nr:hypothetical protein [Candidatus Colwellbacteria bacterium]
MQQQSASHCKNNKLNMLSANLLPPEQKTIVMRELTGRTIRFFAAVFVFVFFLHTIFILPFFFSTYFIKNVLERSLALEQGAAEKLRVPKIAEEALGLKNMLKKIFTHAAESDKASLSFKKFFEFAETGVTLSTVHIEQNGTIFLTGTASTRRNLLLFEKELRQSGRFLEISSPLSNIIEETNAQFTIRGILKELYRL